MIIPFKGYLWKVTHWVTGCRISIWSSEILNRTWAIFCFAVCWLCHQNVSQRSPKPSGLPRLPTLRQPGLSNIRNAQRCRARQSKECYGCWGRSTWRFMTVHDSSWHVADHGDRCFAFACSAAIEQQRGAINWQRWTSQPWSLRPWAPWAPWAELLQLPLCPQGPQGLQLDQVLSVVSGRLWQPIWAWLWPQHAPGRCTSEAEPRWKVLSVCRWGLAALQKRTNSCWNSWQNQLFRISQVSQIQIWSKPVGSVGICRNLLDLWGSDMFCVLEFGRAMLRGTHRCAKTPTPRTPCGDASRPWWPRPRRRSARPSRTRSAVVPVVPVIKAPWNTMKHYETLWLYDNRIRWHVMRCNDDVMSNMSTDLGTLHIFAWDIRRMIRHQSSEILAHFVWSVAQLVADPWTPSVSTFHIISPIFTITHLSHLSCKTHKTQDA